MTTAALRSSAAAWEIVLANRGLARSVANRWGRTPDHREDLEAVAVLALFHAALRWDPSLGKLGTVMRWTSSRRLRLARAGLDAPVSTPLGASVVRAADLVNEDGEITAQVDLLAAEGPTPAEIAEQEQRDARVLTAVEGLPESEQAVIRFRYLETDDEVAIEDVATRLGWSRWRVTVLERAALDRLRATLTGPRAPRGA